MCRLYRVRLSLWSLRPVDLHCLLKLVKKLYSTGVFHIIFSHLQMLHILTWFEFALFFCTMFFRDCCKFSVLPIVENFNKIHKCVFLETESEITAGLWALVAQKWNSFFNWDNCHWCRVTIVLSVHSLNNNECSDFLSLDSTTWTILLFTVYCLFVSIAMLLVASHYSSWFSWWLVLIVMALSLCAASRVVDLFVIVVKAELILYNWNNKIGLRSKYKTIHNATLPTPFYYDTLMNDHRRRLVVA